jgi:hypothetical protein
MVHGRCVLCIWFGSYHTVAGKCSSQSLSLSITAHYPLQGCTMLCAAHEPILSRLKQVAQAWACSCAIRMLLAASVGAQCLSPSGTGMRGDMTPHSLPAADFNAAVLDVANATLSQMLHELDQVRKHCTSLAWAQPAEITGRTRSLLRVVVQCSSPIAVIFAGNRCSTCHRS